MGQKILVGAVGTAVVALAVLVVVTVFKDPEKAHARPDSDEPPKRPGIDVVDAVAREQGWVKDTNGVWAPPELVKPKR